MGTPELPLRYVDVDGHRIAYREAGEGPAVLLVHGWPTSSYLWRNSCRRSPPATGWWPWTCRASALRTSRPSSVTTSPSSTRSSTGSSTPLGIQGQVALAVHDLGGPLGLHWAARNPDRLWALVLCNTLAYPELGQEVIDFARTLLDPARRDELTTPKYLEEAMRLGGGRRAPDHAGGRRGGRPRRSPRRRPGSPWPWPAAGLRRPGLAEIAKWLPTVSVPVRVIYGQQDRLLPDVAHTMARVAADIPHAEVTLLPDCGHFVQEDAPDRLGSMLASFLAGADP